MVKKEIRRLFIEKRNSLSSSDIVELDAAIAENFRQLNLHGVQVVLSYRPIASRKEFDAGVCADILSLENDGLTVALPRINNDVNTMDAVRIHKRSSFAANRYNIHEPLDGEVIDPVLIDLVFVPLLAFDTKGYRVGYGKGFYDRYLDKCSQDVVKVGFSYFEAVDAIDDVHEYDVPLNFCITPMRVYEF